MMTAPFYLNEKELSVELGLTDDQLRKFLTAHSKSPAMKVDPLTGKRFWPAIKQYLFHHHGISASMPLSTDGEENWK